MNKVLRLFLGFALAVFLSCPTYAANSCAAKTPLPISIWGVTSVIPVECTLDTTSSDLTIYTPGTGNMAAIVGMNAAETTAHNITFTNGSDAEFVMEINTAGETGAFAGLTSDRLFYIGQPSQAVKIQTSAAYTSNLLFYVIEAPRFFK